MLRCDVVVLNKWFEETSDQKTKKREIFGISGLTKTYQNCRIEWCATDSRELLYVYIQIKIQLAIINQETGENLGIFHDPHRVL